MGARWTLKDAKSRFGELVERALEQGPQTVTRDGEDVVVVRAAKRPRARKRKDFKEFLLSAGSLEGVDLTRDKSLPRDIDW